MLENEEKKFKLRLKLKSGEEFEAEGSLSFIEKQKEAFLRLAELSAKAENEYFGSYEQKIIPTPTPSNNTPQEGHSNANYYRSINPQISYPNQELNGAQIKEATQTNKAALEEENYSQNTINPQFSNNTPTINNKRYSPKSDIWGNPISQKPSEKVYTPEVETPSNRYTPAYFTKVKAKPQGKQDKKAEQPIPRPEGTVWERIAYPDGRLIILRRRDKTLSTETAALIILGAAKMLNNMPKMSALELSKSLKVSGYLKEKERLDRILAQEIKQSTLVFEGSKRNRDYIITQSGTAKAYTAAERVLLNG